MQEHVMFQPKSIHRTEGGRSEPPNDKEALRLCLNETIFYVFSRFTL